MQGIPAAAAPDPGEATRRDLDSPAGHLPTPRSKPECMRCCLYILCNIFLPASVDGTRTEGVKGPLLIVRLLVTDFGDHLSLHS